MTDIQHPHEENNCQICLLIDEVIRPAIEFQTRKQMVQELEKLLCINDGWDHCIGVNQEHCDDVKECIDIVRGKPSD